MFGGESESVKLSCRQDLEDYCKQNKINMEDFNQPVTILHTT